jgi:hypothetical protein
MQCGSLSDNENNFRPYGDSHMTTTTTDLAAMNAKRAHLKVAFDIVCDARDWKAPISISAAIGLWDRLCAQLGVTTEDVVESIGFFTATQATVVRANGEIRITAPGYRNGPAGDH